jgi:site-specific DNA recombinase
MIAAIYARKSTEQSGVPEAEKSVARQVERARAYAANNGWTVAEEHIYIDDGVSGAEFDNRPAFVRLMAALKPRAPFQVLVMSEESRLGRELIETSYALKQLIKAGVRVFFYLTNTERTLNSATEKALLAVQAMSDEIERERARQRTYDALQRKAAAGHVTGGRVFGFDNRAVLGADGKRSHVERIVNEAQATVVRRIFGLCAEGFGNRQIAYRLNAEGALAPKPQRGRPAGWSPSSLREILRNELYRGVVVWNRTKKRDQWGQVHPTERAATEHLRYEAPHLRIVSDAEWQAAHARIDESRRLYMRATNGQLYGRPERGTESKYLLVGLGRCAVCGAGLSVRSRSHGRRREHYYTCTAHHMKGASVCGNCQEWRLDRIDADLLDGIGEQILTPRILDRVLRRGAGPVGHADARDGGRCRCTNGDSNPGPRADEPHGSSGRRVARPVHPRRDRRARAAPSGAARGTRRAACTGAPGSVGVGTPADGVGEARRVEGTAHWAHGHCPAGDPEALHGAPGGDAG